jgi:hypothetical protein
MECVPLQVAPGLAKHSKRVAKARESPRVQSRRETRFLAVIALRFEFGPR